MAKFLYNGTKLPALPEWDKTAYPYAVIIRTGSSGSTYKYQLICAKLAVETNDNRYRITHPDFKDVSTTPTFVFLGSETIKTGDEGWGALTINSTNLILGYVFWTNYDMKDNDGDLRVARTTPIPVTELDPTILLNGWLVGSAIARHRNNGHDGESNIIATLADKILHIEKAHAVLNGNVLEVK